MWGVGVSRRVVALGVLLFLALLTVNGVMAQDASWTIMVYIEGDNNLEGDALADIQEMEQIGSTDDVNIIVQVDRAEDYSDGDGDWTQARRFRVEQDNIGVTIFDIVDQKFSDPASVRLSTPPLEDLGEINNGDPNTLIDFALWTVDNYPADKYGLVLWNHGGTWIGGFGGDESTVDHDSMDMLELDFALDSITSSIGRNFEFIGFDTCLMGGFEVFSLLAKYSNYAAGSEELEPGFGWYYTPVVELLVTDPSIDGGVLADSVVDSYMAFYNEVWVELSGETYSDFYGGDVYGQTAVDLSLMIDLTDALDTFSAVAVENMDNDLTAAIADARSNTQMFMLSQPDAADEFGSADLKHFMLLLQRFSSNSGVNDAAQGVIDAIDNVVIDHQQTNLDDAHGISIYFPANQRLYESNGLNERYATEVPYMQTWAEFLETYYGIANSVAEASGGRIEITESYFNDGEVSSLVPPTFVYEYEGVNLVSHSFAAILQLPNGRELMIEETPLFSGTITEDGEELALIEDGLNLSQFTWVADMPVITDGDVSVPTVLLSETGDESAVVTGDYTFASSEETISAYAVFDLETTQAVKYLGVNQSENGGQPFEITTSAGDTFSPTWRFFNEEGELELESSGEILVIGDEALYFTYEPAPSGEYELYFLIEDAAGNVYFDTVEVLVNNDDVDLTYRGANDISLGYSTVVPFEWGVSVDVVRDDGSTYTVFSDDEGRVTVLWEFYEAFDLSEMDGAANEYIGLYANEVFEPYDVYFELAEVDGIAYEYTAQTEAGDDAYGVVVYTVMPETGYGYLIDYMVVTDDPTDEEFAYLDEIINQTFFFEPLADSDETDNFGGMTSDEMVGGDTVESIIIEYGYTVEEFNEEIAETGYTVAELQAEIDDGIYSIDEFIVDFFEFED